MSIKNFTISTSVLIIILSALIIGFNYKTNPYSYFNANYEDSYDLTGFWRTVKPQWYKQKKYDAVIIGSSRSQSGFNPDTYESLTDKSIYNLGLPGMGYYEAYKAVEYVINEKNYNDSLEIILALDVFMMPLTQEIVSNRNVTWLPKKKGFFGKIENQMDFYARMLFSSKTLNKSFEEVNRDTSVLKSNLLIANKLASEATKLKTKVNKTRDQIKEIRRRLKAKEVQKEDVKREKELIKRKLRSVEKWDSIITLKNFKSKQKKKSKGKLLIWQKNGFSKIGLKSFESKRIQRDLKKWRKRKKIMFSNEKLEYFEKTIQLVCENPHVKLTMIHLPMHNYVQSLFMDMGGDVQISSKKEMAKVFIENKKTCSSIRFYDYFNTNELNTNYLTEIEKSINFRDLSHMRSSYGDIILKEIFGSKRFSSKYGKELKTLGAYNKYLEEDQRTLKSWKQSSTELYGKSKYDKNISKEDEDEEDEGLEI